MTTIPGFSISILRQQTFGGVNQPINISGRVTGFGFPAPALVRVTLDGPEHNPEQRTFDTSALAGDYQVTVLAEKEGQYTVQAEAAPPFALPVPAAAESLLKLPAFAVSSSPPLAIGRVSGDELLQDLGEGVTQRVSQPPSSQIEIITPISVEVGGGAAAPAPSGVLPFLTGFPGPGVVVPTPAPAPAPAPAPTPEGTRLSGRIVSFTIV